MNCKILLAKAVDNYKIIAYNTNMKISRRRELQQYVD